MGLGTTHNCWSGPYSMFHRWREALHRALGNEGTLDAAWQAGKYQDQSVPINVLMNHSDCDGEIPADVCGPLADALAAIQEKMPDVTVYSMRWMTEKFIQGLRLAASLGEPVEFH